MPSFTNASNVRAYAGVMAINTQEDRWQEGPLGSNIRAASAFLQKPGEHHAPGVFIGAQPWLTTSCTLPFLTSPS